MALDQLQLQMTQTTFDTWLRQTRLLERDGDTLVVSTNSAFARDWLQDRLYETINRTVTGILGGAAEVRFVVDEATPADPEVEVSAEPDRGGEPERQSPTPGQVVAQTDYYKGFFERGGSGFSQLVHHTTYFWMPLLGPAFFLWKLLDSDDTRALKAIKPNFWTPPQKYSFSELAAKLNRQQGRYIGGDALECQQSRLARQAGHPLLGLADCCGGPNYDRLRLKAHPRGQGVMCQHWKEGLLEILWREGLAQVELNPGERKPTIQVWRMPPLITPRQYARLNSQLQADYDDWLEKYGSLFGILDRRDWQAITEPSLVPLMPDYEQVQVTDNFEHRRKKQEFMQNAVPNPNFVPCMANNSTA